MCVAHVGSIKGRIKLWQRSRPGSAGKVDCVSLDLLLLRSSGPVPVLILPPHLYGQRRDHITGCRVQTWLSISCRLQEAADDEGREIVRDVQRFTASFVSKREGQLGADPQPSWRRPAARVICSDEVLRLRFLSQAD